MRGLTAADAPAAGDVIFTVRVEAAGMRIRHRAPEVPATVSLRDDGRAIVHFDRPVRAAAPGQSCVFYRGDVVLGGGVIRRKSSD